MSSYDSSDLTAARRQKRTAHFCGPRPRPATHPRGGLSSRRTRPAGEDEDAREKRNNGRAGGKGNARAPSVFFLQKRRNVKKTMTGRGH